jgi:hypothetical protein
MFVLEPKDWLTLGGISLTFFISLISLYISIRNTRKTLFINSITKSRIEWIGTIRENIAKFCGLTFHVTLTDLEPSERRKVLEEIDKVKYLIILQLNREDEFDKKIISTLKMIASTAKPQNITQLEKDIEYLILLTQDLLKLEWEGAKLESMKGIISRREKDTLYEKHLKIKK